MLTLRDFGCLCRGCELNHPPTLPPTLNKSLPSWPPCPIQEAIGWE